MSILEKEDFIQKAEQGEFKSFMLGFDNCISVEFEGETLNRTICDFLHFRQKAIPSRIQFRDFYKNVKYFVLRGCTIKNINYNYKGSLWHMFRTWCRVKMVKRFQKENNNVL